MTPLEMRLCLHYATTATDDPWIFSGAPIVNEVLGGLLAQEMLFENRAGSLRKFSATAKTMAYVQMLCDVPLPVAAWVDERTYKFPPITYTGNSAT